MRQNPTPVLRSWLNRGQCVNPRATLGRLGCLPAVARFSCSRPHGHVPSNLKAAALLALVLTGATLCSATGVDLQPGDLIARRGAGLFSAEFASASPQDKRFSHIGVVVGDAGAWAIIHALADDETHEGAVRRDSLAIFLGDATAHAVFRVQLSAEQRAKFVAGIERQAAERTPFDRDFSLEDSSRVYCTELIWCELRSVLGSDPAPHKSLLFGRSIVTIESITTGSPLVRELPGRAPGH